MGAARKLKNHRRRQRWADKSYKKSHLGNEWKKPFAGSSHAKGIVLEKMYGNSVDAFSLIFFF
jgi:small subunit ribosomal protein S23e